MDNRNQGWLVLCICLIASWTIVNSVAIMAIVYALRGTQ
ncbi:hypothetical protein LCGC14_0322670 [marine sediment metagenome]|uniref:Uncharacterized protein n=1 Tax=marine sediment metagenome TaxID=412755 RepID=A0A0F9WQN4_9ZZZZ